MYTAHALGWQFCAALMTKRFADNFMTVKIVGQPAPDIRDLEYFQVLPATYLEPEHACVHSVCQAPAVKFERVGARVR